MEGLHRLWENVKLAVNTIWIETESESGKIKTMAQIVGADVVGIKQELAILEEMENRIKVTNYEFLFGILFFFDLMKKKMKEKILKPQHRLWEQLLWESLESW